MIKYKEGFIMSESLLKRRKCVKNESPSTVAFNCKPLVALLAQYLHTHDDLVAFKRICRATRGIMGTKHNKRRIKLLKRVTQDGWMLEYVKEQTEEICLAALKNRGWALQHVKEQTEEMCLIAVKRNGYALQHVKEQTDEICLIAVKQYGYALDSVKEQTREMCLAAVKQNGWALQDVRIQTEEICLVAVKEERSALKCVWHEFKYLFK